MNRYPRGQRNSRLLFFIVFLDATLQNIVLTNENVEAALLFGNAFREAFGIFIASPGLFAFPGSENARLNDGDSARMNALHSGLMGVSNVLLSSGNKFHIC